LESSINAEKDMLDLSVTKLYAAISKVKEANKAF